MVTKRKLYAMVLDLAVEVDCLYSELKKFEEEMRPKASKSVEKTKRKVGRPKGSKNKSKKAE